MIDRRLRALVAAIVAPALLVSCGDASNETAYSGSFEAQEVLVSSEANGRVVRWVVDDGQTVKVGQLLGEVDSTLLVLQRQELAEQVRGMEAQMPDDALKAAAIEEKIHRLTTDRARIERLVRAQAASRKRLDDIDAQLATHRSARAALSRLSKREEQAVAQRMALAIRDEQLRYHVAQCRIVSPVQGTVLQRYVSAGELVGAGSPLVRVANMTQLTLRAYVPYEGLQRVAVGDTVTVQIDSVAGAQATFSGCVTWISQEAEFTPRAAQTQDMRESLMYAVKVSVPNPDGVLKRGMYGEIRLPALVQ